MSARKIILDPAGNCLLWVIMGVVNSDLFISKLILTFMSMTLAEIQLFFVYTFNSVTENAQWMFITKQPMDTFERLFSIAGRIMPVKQSLEKVMEGLSYWWGLETPPAREKATPKRRRTPYNGPKREAPPKRDTIFRVQVYKREEIFTSWSIWNGNLCLVILKLSSFN